MKKIYSIFLILFSAATIINAQTIVTTSQNYNNLKQAGKLDPKVKYKILNESYKEKNAPVRPSARYNRSTPNVVQTGTTGCNVSIPLDSTFSIADFTDGDAPDYTGDDGSSTIKNLPFSFCMYGTTYNACYINRNGNISFANSSAVYSSTGFPNSNDVMIAPFWADVDTRDAGSGLVYYAIHPTYMVIKWDHVGYFDEMSDKVNDFELIITNGSDPILPSGNNIAFIYGDMQWTTGSASGGVGGFGGTAATVGVNKGDGTNYIQIGRFNLNNSSYDGPYGANDGINFLDNKSYFFNTCGTNNNLPPIVQDATGGGSACGDTISICALGDTLVYTTSFLAPENNQTVSITGSAPTLGSSFVPLGVTTTTAGITTYAWMVIASSTVTGVHTVVITGTDNGTPPLSSSATYYVKIKNVSVPHPTLSITPATGSVCATPGATVTLTNCGAYDNVYWSNGTSGCSTIANATGIYYVTVSKLGCYKSSYDSVAVYANPVPVVLGPLNYCSPATSTTLSLAAPLTGMAAYNTYTWTAGAIHTPTASLTGTAAGTHYTVAVTDAHGCKGQTTFTVSSSSPTVGITATPLSICGAGSSTLVASIAGATSYSWSNGGTTQTTTVNIGGIYSVSVTNNNCVSTKTVNVSISPIPTVAITPSLTLCSGSSGTISVLSFTPTGSYTYTWSTGAHTPTVLVNADTLISLVVTNTVTGCVSDTSNVCAVSISSNPAPSLIIAGPFNYCFPATSTVLNILPPVAGMPAYSTYSWSPGAIPTSSANLTGPTGYTVTVTDVNGCYASQAFTVSNASPTLAVTANPASLCGTTPSTLTPSISGATSYSWSTGATTETISVTTSGTYSVGVVASGCTVGTTVSVVINPTPTVTIPPNLGICSGAAAIVTTISIAPPGAYTYTWSNTSHNTSVSITTPTVLTLQITNSATGCSALSNSCTIVVASNPTVSLSGTPVIFCEGSNATLTPTITGGTPSYSYSWAPASLGNGPTATTPNVGTYSVLVADQNLCVGSGTVATVKSSPSVALSSPDLVICPGECSIITATALSSYSPFTYSWSPVSAGNNSTATASVCVAGPVTVTVTDAKGCIATNIITVTNDVSPIASFTYSPASPVAAGQTINFTSTSTIPTGAITSTTWLFGDGNSASGTPVTHAYTLVGPFTVTLTVAGSAGCLDMTTTIINVDATLIIPNVITPNGDGANDFLKFKYLENFGNNNLTVFNRWGVKVFEQDNYKNDWNGGGHVDGTYFFVLSIPNATPNIYKGYFQLIR